MMDGWIEAEGGGDALVLHAKGTWCVDDAAGIERRIADVAARPPRQVTIDLADVEALDTAGAWLMLRLERALAEKGADVSLAHVAKEIEPLLRQVEKGRGAAPPPLRPGGHGVAWVEKLGLATVDVLASAANYLSFLGLVTVTGLRALRQPKRIRIVPTVAQMERVGVAALPIVGLLSFVIGIVTAYQGADQLKRFGAELLTVNLLGLGFLREMGVLLAGIIVAGRSGSAFTAELGAMQVNEEIDALRTLALDPIELLVLPRLTALVLVMPLLAFWANFMGLLGGAMLCWLVLGITLPTFSQQLHEALYLWTYWLGIIKAPFFGAAIALVGCHEGLTVQRNAESLGLHTTRAVVHSIFLVIIIDAAFSILFAWLDV